MTNEHVLLLILSMIALIEYMFRHVHVNLNILEVNYYNLIKFLK